MCEWSVILNHKDTDVRNIAYQPWLQENKSTFQVEDTLTLTNVLEFTLQDSLKMITRILGPFQQVIHVVQICHTREQERHLEKTTNNKRDYHFKCCKLFVYLFRVHLLLSSMGILYPVKCKAPNTRWYGLFRERASRSDDAFWLANRALRIFGFVPQKQILFWPYLKSKTVWYWPRLFIYLDVF